nr:hypothetical protein [Armatimonadota bacterium]
MRYTTIAICVIFAASATAQWTVVNLHPGGAEMSRAFAVRDGKQVGSAVVGGVVRASLWSGTAASWVDLSPVGQQGGSEAVGLDGPMQVGHASVNGSGGACYWSGTAGSWVNMHPGGSWSYIMDADAGTQVGVVGFGLNHAALWSGTPGSWIDLHPPSAQESEANGVHAAQQVGTARVGGVYRASLWTGTWDTWVDLHPTGASESFGMEIHAGTQVGWATVGGVQHACLWQGTATSWVDLNQPGVQSSRAMDCHAGQQVGGATTQNREHASLWDNSATSRRDLHVFLPSGFSDSTAWGIWNDADLTYIVGDGRHTSDGRLRALMWISRSVAPASYSMVRG